MYKLAYCSLLYNLGALSSVNQKFPLVLPTTLVQTTALTPTCLLQMEAGVALWLFGNLS